MISFLTHFNHKKASSIIRSSIEDAIYNILYSLESIKDKVKPLLHISKLNLQLGTALSPIIILQDIDIVIHHNEILGLVGPSGSGKSMCIKCIIRLMESFPYYKLSGNIAYNKEELVTDILTADISTINAIRKNEIGIIFQQSSSVLNPSIRVGQQIGERLEGVKGFSKVDRKQLVLDVLSEVGLLPVESYYRAYPHELSGGQLQRILIAMAIINKPTLLLADEPCSNLDITTQKEIIGLLQKIHEKYSMSILFVSHDRELVDGFCSRVILISEGKISDSEIDNSIKGNPSIGNESSELNGESDLIVELENGIFSYKKRGLNLWNRSLTDIVIDKLSIKIYRGHIKGIVGPSGCGKSTVARIISGILELQDGSLKYNSKEVSEYLKSERTEYRRSVQMIFQDSQAAMPPHIRVEQLLIDTAKAHGKPHDLKSIELKLRDVGLDNSLLDRLPSQLSGGQRQRLLIAKALLVEPELLVCDEILSSIDSHNKDGIINLLKTLNRESGLTILFISHDLSLVNQLCDDILVMT